MHSLLSIVVNMSLQLISASVALHSIWCRLNSISFVAYIFNFILQFHSVDSSLTLIFIIQFHSVVTDCLSMHSFLSLNVPVQWDMHATTIWCAITVVTYAMLPSSIPRRKNVDVPYYLDGWSSIIDIIGLNMLMCFVFQLSFCKSLCSVFSLIFDLPWCFSYHIDILPKRFGIASLSVGQSCAVVGYPMELPFCSSVIPNSSL